MEYSARYRKVQPVAQPSARRSRGKQAKTAERSKTSTANDFLKQRFTPYVSESIAGSHRQVERDFFSSLSNLCRLYSIPVWDYLDRPYPLNISTAYKETRKRLAAVDKDLHLAIVEQENNITLATCKDLTPSYSLYYIPVRPLFELPESQQAKQLSALLLSVYAYLYRVLKVPSYASSDSYLYYVYDMLIEYCMEEYWEDIGERSSYVRAIKHAISKGKKLDKKLRGVKHLLLFGQRLKKFKPETYMEKGLKNVAAALYRLYQRFPQRSLSGSLNTAFLDPEAEYRINFDQYLSFIWDIDDCVCHDLIEHVKADLQEATEQQSPCSIQLFDKPQSGVTIDLTFEKKAFGLINDLVYYLTKL